MKHYEELTSCVTEKIEFGNLSILVLSEPTKLLAEHGELVAELAVETLYIANQAFGSLGERTPATMLDRVIRAEKLALLEDRGEIIGFSSGKNYPNEKIFYFDGVAVLPKVSGGGKGTKLVEVIASGAPRVACTTQNPAIFHLLKKLYVSVIPSLEGRSIPAALRHIAVHVVGPRGRLDLETFVIRDLYPSCRYPQIPTSNDLQIDRWFSNSLNIVNGETRDGFFFIAE
jgi:hypothetical protein